MSVARKAMAEHTKSCSHWPVKCSYCGTSVRRSVLSVHHDKCTNYPVICASHKDKETESKGCGQHLIRSELRTHRLDDCPKAIIACPFGCANVYLQRDSMTTHEKEYMMHHMHALSKKLHSLTLEHTALQLAVSRLKLKPYFFVIGGADEKDTPLAGVYGWDGLSWQTFPSLSIKAQAHSGAVGLNDKLYMATAGTIHILNTDTRNWSSVNGVPSVATTSPSVIVGSRLYIMSSLCMGYYDMNKQYWVSLQMETYCTGITAAVVDPTNTKRILVFGGRLTSTDACSADTRALDTSSHTWVVLAPASVARRGHRAIITKENKVWVLGGQNDTKCIDLVEEYDPATNTW